MRLLAIFGIIGGLCFVGSISRSQAQTVISVTGCQTISSSGSYQLANNITGGAWCISIRAGNVVFDGNGKTITSSTGEALEVAHFSGTAPTNVTVRNFSSTGTIRTFGDDIDGVTIEGVTVEGITAYGSDNVTINNNVVGSGGISANESDNDWHPYHPVITNNTITGQVGHTTKILLEIAGGKYHPCPRIEGVVTGNTVNNYRDDFPQPEATAVIRIRCATHNTVTNNFFRSHGTTMGLYIRDESDDGLYENNVFWTNMYPALWIASGNPDKTFPSRNVFHNNTFRTDGAYAFYGSAVGSGNVFTYNTFSSNSDILGYVGGYYNNTFDHNTFYNVGTGSLITLQGNNQEGPPADTYTNNIFSYGGTYVFGYDQWRTSRYIGDHNVFFNRSGALSFGSIGNLGAWRTATGDDANSMDANPLLTDPAGGDFTIGASSPARGAGTGGSDIGAKPYGSAPPPTCTESWTCGAWSSCSSGTQTRICTDSNSCGTTATRPALTQSCVMPDTTAPAAIQNLAAH